MSYVVSDRGMMLPLRQHSEGLGSPLTRISARAQALGHMLKEEGRGEEEEEEKIGGVVSRRLRAEMTAVAEEWQRWQAQETEVRRAAEEALRASDAWRAAEERCEAAGDAADRAGERAREARALAERACLDRHPRRAIAVRRLRSAAEEELNACLAADADGDAADEASEALDASNAGLEAAMDRADAARERLRDAEQGAAWSRAVAVLARLRAARRRALWSEAPERACDHWLEECSHVSVLEEAQDGPGGRVTGDAKGESVAPVTAVPCRSVLARHGVAAVAWGARRRRGDAGRGDPGGGGRGCDGRLQWRQFDPGGASVS